MNLKITIFVLAVLGGTSLWGCGQPLPEKPKTTGGMASPERALQRIKDTEANPKFTREQKDQIIATIKQRNHMQ